MVQCSLSDFTDGYITAALWSSGEGDIDCFLHSDHELSDETAAQMRADCRAFFTANEANILCDNGPTGKDGTSQAAMAGHDFWLTRCGHGAGFWDGDWPDPHAQALINASEMFGLVDLYLGDDGLICST